MKLISNENNQFISAIVHWMVNGEMTITPITAVPIPTNKIVDIQSYLKEEFLKRSQSIIKNSIKEVQSKLIESIHNATFSDIQYIEDLRKVFLIEGHENCLEIYE